MRSILFILVSAHVLFGFGEFFILSVNGHGRTITPVSRLTRMANNCGFVKAWFYGYEFNVGRAQSVNPGFECGVCGDDIGLPQSRRIHELGNPNLTPTVTSISLNGLLEVKMAVEVKHKGIIQWRLCCNQTQERDSNITIAQGCFNRNLLKINSSSTGIPGVISSGDDRVNVLHDQQVYDDPPTVITALLVLPKSLESEFCTLQMNYRTDPDCDAQHNETFRSCSNLQIVSDMNHTKVKKEFTFLKHKDSGLCLTLDNVHWKITLDTCGTKSTRLLQNLLPVQPWKEYETEYNVVMFELSATCLSPMDYFYSRWIPYNIHTILAVTCLDSPEFLWKSIPIGGNWLRLQNQNSKLCLSATFDWWGSTISEEYCYAYDPKQQWELNTLSI